MIEYLIYASTYTNKPKQIISVSKFNELIPKTY